MPQPSSPPATGAVRLANTSDVNGCERASTEQPGKPYVWLARRWWRWQRTALLSWGACTYESDSGRSLVSVSSSSSVAVAVVAAMSACTR
jgi:hypothetical protein